MRLRGLIVAGLLLLVCAGQAAFADDTLPAPVNDPPGAYTTAKAVLDRLDLSYESLWDWSAGTFSQGVSGSVYDVRRNNLHIASVRLGAGTGMSLYSGIGWAVPGLTKLLVPATIKGIATTGPLDTLWGVVGKYGRISTVGGYSWDHHDPIIGLTFGAAATF